VAQLASQFKQCVRERERCVGDLELRDRLAERRLATRAVGLSPRRRDERGAEYAGRAGCPGEHELLLEQRPGGGVIAETEVSEGCGRSPVADPRGIAAGTREPVLERVEVVERCLVLPGGERGAGAA
jgi:hypothetical protein